MVREAKKAGQAKAVVVLSGTYQDFSNLLTGANFTKPFFSQFKCVIADYVNINVKKEM